MKSIPIIIGIIVGFIALIILYQPFFGKEKDFLESFACFLKPRGIGWPEFDYFIAMGKVIKFIVYFIVITGIGYFAYILIEYHFFYRK